MRERPILFCGPDWHPVRGYEAEYAVSRDGRVGSLRSQREIAVSINNCGYKTVLIRRKGSAKRALVHRLVAEAFVPNPDNKPIVNHIDGVKLNCAPDNLEWVTAAENNAHAWRNGLARVRAQRALSDETRAKISAALKGRKSPCGFAGKKRSSESIAKFQESMRLRQARKGVA